MPYEIDFKNISWEYNAESDSFERRLKNDEYECVFESSQIVAAPIEIGDRVTYLGVDYRVKNIEPEKQGMTKLILEKSNAELTRGGTP